MALCQQIKLPAALDKYLCADDMRLYDHDKSYVGDARPPGNPNRGLVAPARPLSAIRVRGALFSIELLLSLKRSRFADAYNELACHTQIDRAKRAWVVPQTQ
jgi:hypothetical protein